MGFYRVLGQFFTVFGLFGFTQGSNYFFSGTSNRYLQNYRVRFTTYET